MGDWSLRAILFMVSLALTVLLVVAGFSQEISAGSARQIYSSTEQYTEGLVVKGDFEATALNIFLDFAPLMLVCNTPVLGPLIAGATSYYTGYVSKAQLVATGKGGLQALFSDVVSLLQVLAISIASAEGMLLSYKLLKRQRAEFLETVAVLVFEVGLAVLVASIWALEAS
ncbi:hypothetical protein IG193_03730 [Infirmifilum lucidum]|uniref:Uncharacterized protein n=1 Tax=Infirmifilum lucidum TaxID=2776706 RepID=A0A7L9FIB7_9CREN|nr:hypothetical protein [Infirmifilum lucidum]QOJ79578.1 hypothetical protein IG193_03730 [Infirmifilum lucidum]